MAPARGNFKTDARLRAAGDAARSAGLVLSSDYYARRPGVLDELQLRLPGGGLVGTVGVGVAATVSNTRRAALVMWRAAAAEAFRRSGLQRCMRHRPVRCHTRLSMQKGRTPTSGVAARAEQPRPPVICSAECRRRRTVRLHMRMAIHGGCPGASAGVGPNLARDRAASRSDRGAT